MVGVASVSAGDWVASPYASETIEHNTDVFDLPKNGAAPEGKNGPTFADTYFHTAAGIDGTYLLGQQKLFGTAEVSRFDYDNFSSLNHNENLFDGGMKWKLAHALDGLVEYKHAQTMVQFQDLAAARELIVQTENTGTLEANVAVTPEFRWENRFKDRTLDSPRDELPGLSLHEDSVREGFKYIGLSNLSAGLEAEYLKGTYRHDPLALDPEYHQESLAAAATYAVSGFTNFNGNLGYTKRTDPSASGLSGITGNIAYQHSLSGRTVVNVQLSRAINSYLTTGGNELDTTAVVALAYQATYKITVNARYLFTQSKFPEAPLGFIVIDRLDHYHTASLDLRYQVLRWLQIRPYASYQTRSSNDPLFPFSGTIYGVELLAKRAQPALR